MTEPRAPKIMLIRHAEKPDDNPPPHGVTALGEHNKESLSVRGWTRAGALVGLFAPANGQFQDALLATPQVIYACGIGPGSQSHRHQETVTPLLEKLGAAARPNFDFRKGQEKQVMSFALDEEGMVLVCWEHDRIPKLAAQIPLSAKNVNRVPEKWDEPVFDRVWVFTRDDASGGYVFSEVLQHLLAGDA